MEHKSLIQPVDHKIVGFKISNSRLLLIFALIFLVGCLSGAAIIVVINSSTLTNADDRATSRARRGSSETSHPIGDCGSEIDTDNPKLSICRKSLCMARQKEEKEKHLRNTCEFEKSRVLARNAELDCALYLQNGTCHTKLQSFEQKLAYCARGGQLCRCPNADQPCPIGWTYSSNLRNCYKVIFQMDGLNFREADATCRKHGGLLTSLHSQEELDLIISLTTTLVPMKSLHHTLIGASTGTSGVFQWIDGSPIDFLAYGKGQPDNQGDKQNCWQVWTSRIDEAHFGFTLNEADYFGKVDDASCDLKYPNAVCKRAPLLL